MTVDEIKASVTVPQVLNRYGLRPDRRGYIRCPFHGERTASLKVWEDRWHCFGCGAGGDIFDLVERFEGCDFSTAFKALGGNSSQDATSIRSIRDRHRQRDYAEEIQSQVRQMLSGAIATARKIELACRPTDPDKEYPETWCRAVSDLQRLNYLWESLYIDQSFPWREETVHELRELCRAYIE